MPLYELIQRGWQGTEATLRRMTELAAKDARDWFFIKQVSRIVRACPPRDQLCELDALLRFVKGFVRYQPDPLTALHGYVELVQAPLQTMVRRAGDCVPLSQKVILRNKKTGQYEVKPVGDIRESFADYDALSYAMDGKQWVFSPITRWLDKGKRPVVNVKLGSGMSFRCTNDHKVWGILGQGPSVRKPDREKFVPQRLPLSEARQGSSSTFRGLMCAHRIPELGSVNSISPEQLYVEGMYVAEGYAAAPYKVEISNKDDEIIDTVCRYLDVLGAPWRLRSRKDGVKLVYVKASDLSRRLHGFGKNSRDIGFPEEYLSLSADDITQALHAYGLGDAYFPKPGSAWHDHASKIYNTSSGRLSEQLFLMHLILGSPLSIWYQRCHMGAGKHPMYRLICRDRNETRAHVERMPDIYNSTIKSVTDDGEAEVCDISVAGTRNFVTEQGVVLSNCDDMSAWIAAAALALGLRPKFIVIKANESEPDEYSHVYAAVQVKGRWYGMDATVPTSTVGWEPPRHLGRGEWRI